MDDVTRIEVKKYSREVPHTYRKRKKKDQGKSIRISPEVHKRLFELKHGHMSISDVIAAMLPPCPAEPGTNIIEPLPLPELKEI